jgi:hypothetical protein
MEVLSFENLRNLPNGEKVTALHNAKEISYVKVNTLQGNVFLCQYLNGKDSAIQLSEKEAKSYMFIHALNGIDVERVKAVLFTQLQLMYESEAAAILNIYK